MKKLRFLFLAIPALIIASAANAQTADEIIATYLKAVGGKDRIAKITSVYTESTMDVMGNQGSVKITTLNGKGMKQEIDVMGMLMVTCYNDKDGWSINPMAGSSTAETMPDAQYKQGKDQIFIEGPFVNFAGQGYKAELLGKEAVNGADAYKIKITSPDAVSNVCYFDAATGYMVRTIQTAEMQGTTIDNTMTFSDFRDTDGYKSPWKIEMDMGGQFQMTMTVTKTELNKAVDEAIFKKP